MISGDDEDVLRFVRNGVPQAWTVAHQSPEYLDTLSILEHIGELAPDTADDPRRFYALPSVGGPAAEGSDDVYVLLTPRQAAALGEALGIRLAPG